jgi:cytochrome P450
MTTGHVPVRRVADGNYLVTGFAEALFVLSDDRLLNDPANSAHLREDIGPHGEFDQRRGTSMERCDAPQHKRLRREVAAALSQRSYAGQLDQMKQRAEHLFGAVLTRGEGDLVADLLLPVVFGVICDLLGIPEVDRRQVHVWSDDSMLMDPDVSKVAAAALDEYLASLLTVKEKRTAGDLCSALAAARTEGRLSDAEAIGTTALMLIAGYEAMVSFLSASALVFLTSPRLVQLMLQRPELMPTALEELLRYITPQRTAWARFATADVPVGDTVVPSGSAVIVDFAFANRDPLRFGTPERFDPTRTDNKHLAFGHGPHYCPGASLARRQSRIVLDVMLPHMHLLALTTPAAEISWHQTRFSRRPVSVPIAVVRRGREDAP